MGSGRVVGKTALVTGGASGIGAAIAAELSCEGASVFVTDLNEAAGTVVAADLTGGRFLRHDVTNEEDWREVIAAVEGSHDGLDILVNNAGVMPALKTIEETDYDEWRRVMAVNMDGVFLGVKHGIGAMKARGGAIVNISSIAVECAHLGYPIRINSVHPGYIDGGMFGAMADTFGVEGLRERFAGKTPMRRLGEPEEIAKGVLFLVSDDSSYSTGSELVLDGGYTAR